MQGTKDLRSATYFIICETWLIHRGRVSHVALLDMPNKSSTQDKVPHLRSASHYELRFSDSMILPFSTSASRKDPQQTQLLQFKRSSLLIYDNVLFDMIPASPPRWLTCFIAAWLAVAIYSTAVHQLPDFFVQAEKVPEYVISCRSRQAHCCFKDIWDCYLSHGYGCRLEDEAQDGKHYNNKVDDKCG